MAAATSGSGDDTKKNSCGIYKSHAYSILAAFTLKDGAVDEKVLMMRNPWGSTYYTGKWRYNDAAWTDTLAAQVPLGVDPRTSNAQGIFVMPKSGIAKDTACFESFFIAHIHDQDGYKDTWYDAINQDETFKIYEFKPT